MINKIKNKWRSFPITVKVSVAYVICSILQRALSFITLPLFTRLLTTEQYGQFTVYSSWQGIFSIILTLNLAYGSFGPAMMKFENRRDEYISSIQGIFLLISGLFLLVYLPFQNIWNKLFEMPTVFILLLVFETIALNSVQLWSGKKQYEFKYKSVVAVTLLTSIIGPVFAYFLVINTAEKGYARIFGYALTNVIIGGCIFALNWYKGKKIYNKEFWKYAFNFNIPLLAYYLSQMIFNQSDRIMISHYTGNSDAAKYGVAYSFAMILTFVLNAINNSYVPWMYRKIKEDKFQENKNAATAIAALMAVLILLVIWFGPEIIGIMAGEKYAEAVYVIPPVAMSLLLLFYSQLFINVEFYYEEKKKLVWASIGAALLNIVLNALLIPVCGFVAAGYTTLFSYIVFAFANYKAMKTILVHRNIENNGFDYRGLMLLLAAFMIIGFLGLALYNHSVLRLVVGGIAIVVLLLNYKKILSLKEMLK